MDPFAQNVQLEAQDICHVFLSALQTYF